jgi:hypothetical protein
VTLVAGTAVVGVGTLAIGTIVESNWTIFAGGIVLIAGIVMVGVVLIPAVLGVNIVRAIAARLGGRP